MIDRACISLGEKCNLKCSYCHFTDRLSNTSQEFTIEELTTVLDRIHEYCLKKEIPLFKVGIVGSGEPLLEFEKIQFIIEYVIEKGYTEFLFYTITNGTVLTDNILEFFFTHKDLITLCFSLDGYEELHNSGRERFQDAFKGVLKYERTFGHKPPVNCTVHRGTIINAKKTREFFLKEGFKEVTFSRLVDTDEDTLTITDEEYALFIEGCASYDFSVRQLKKENSKKYDCTMYGKQCGVGRTNLFITQKGIYPCGRFYGSEEFNYGGYDSDLEQIQIKMNDMRPLSDGQCYYDTYVGGQK